MKILFRAFRALSSRWRNLCFRLLGVHIEGYCSLRAVEISHDWECIYLGKGVALDRGVVLQVIRTVPEPRLEIGAGTYVNRGTYFDAHQELRVGKNCLIGPYCYLTDANHSFALGKPVASQTMRPEPVVIGNNVWIGAHCIVLPGVTIGDGAVIGAGSLVTHDIPAGMLAYGRPAQVVRALQPSAKA
jgi:acetyltransferase-like isoleucine patch superfamily enzyme